MKFSWKEDTKKIIVVCLAAVLMAVNIKSFVRTGGLYPGGVTGMTLLIQRAVEQFFQIHLPFTLVNLVLNTIPVYIGFRYIGKKFTLYSCLMLVLTSILTDIMPSYAITYDVLLISIFGGMINGFVISLCLMMGTTTGGTDFIAIYFSEKKGIDCWNMILAANVVILAVAGVLFGWDKALYSIIFQYASTQVLHILYKKYQEKTLIIVTDKAEKICDIIYETTHHGATILEGEGSHDKEMRQVVYSVISSSDSKKVLKAVKEADPDSFVNMMNTDRILGRFYHAPNE